MLAHDDVGGGRVAEHCLAPESGLTIQILDIHSESALHATPLAFFVGADGHAPFVVLVIAPPQQRTLTGAPGTCVPSGFPEQVNVPPPDDVGAGVGTEDDGTHAQAYCRFDCRTPRTQA